jgi:hypothetical protein
MGGMSHLLAAERGDLAFETDLRQFGNLILIHPQHAQHLFDHWRISNSGKSQQDKADAQ